MTLGAFIHVDSSLVGRSRFDFHDLGSIQVGNTINLTIVGYGTFGLNNLGEVDRLTGTIPKLLDLINA